MHKQQVYTFTVPEGKRIAVKTGDIIGIHYGCSDSNPLGVPFDDCKSEEHPENSNVFWLHLRHERETLGKVYSFIASQRWGCRVFSLKAFVTVQVI